MSGLSGHIGRTLVNWVTIDTRTLAVFRIALGLIILADLLARSSTFRYFYTEDGVVPMELARERARDYAFSLYWASEHTLITAILFIIPALIAVQLIIGYHTHLATMLSFLFVISLDHRNILVLSHADLIFALLLFWAIFIPLGERWSIDSLKRSTAPRASVANLATAAILMQMVYMYLINGYQKLGSDAWRSGEATPIIFGLDDMTFFLAEPMTQFPTLLMIGGTTWYYMLLMSPLLIVLWGRPRMMFAFMFIIAHASFFVTVRIGGFAPVALAGAMLFLQAQFWNDLQAVAGRISAWKRYKYGIRESMDRIGRRISDHLPSADKPLNIPAVVQNGTFDAFMAIAIVVLFVLPTLNLFADEGHIEWEQSSLEEQVQDVKRAFAVRQPPWNVFAPNPRNVNRYYVFAAETKDGELLDLYSERPFTFERPDYDLQRQYTNYRERFYMDNIRRDGDHRAAPVYLANHLCEEWRDERGIRLRQINMYLVNEIVTVDTIADPEGRELRSELLSTHGCFGNEPGEIELPEDSPHG